MAAIGTNEASGDTVYAAIELSKRNWVIGIARPERERPSIVKFRLMLAAVSANVGQ